MTLLGMQRAYKPLATAPRRSEAVKQGSPSTRARRHSFLQEREEQRDNDDNTATTSYRADADAGAARARVGIAR